MRLRETIAGLPRPFWFLWAGQLANRLGYFVEPFFTLYLVRGRDLPISTAGVLVAAFGVGALASQVVGGWLADTIGRRRTLTLGMVGTAMAMLGLGFVTALPLLAAFALVTGLFIDVYRPAVAALVADLIPPAERPRAFALLYWALNLGVAFGAIVGGALATRGYWILFVLDAATCLVFAALVHRGVPETRPEPTAGGNTAGGYGPALRDRLLLALSAMTLVGASVYIQSFITLPLAVTADGLGPAAYGIVYAVNPIAIIVLQPLAINWINARPPIRVYAVSSLVVGVGFGLTGFADSIPAFGATVLVWTAGEIGISAVAPTLIANLAPPDQRGRYNGVLGIAWGGSALLGPIVGTSVLHTYGEPPLWGGCFLAAVAVAAASLVLQPAVERRAAAPPQPSPST